MPSENFQVIIPARYQSSRLPGKPLLDIGGRPMIQHVYERSLQSGAARVMVATDDTRIKEAVEGFGGVAVMTSGDHESGSDRIAEAADVLRLKDETIIVNVQGDEPDISPRLIDQVASALANDNAASIATASAPVDDPSQADDPSVVKVVCNRRGHAMYFSRAGIPHVRLDDDKNKNKNLPLVLRRHLGIYAYTAGYIRRFTSMERCELESLEKLEQLRCLWNGDVINCVEAIEVPGPGIDTQRDLEAARRKAESDKT